MVTMDPSSWNGSDHSLPSAADDDFNQFLDMGGMSNMGEPLHFDFQDFAAPGPGPMMPAQPPREVMDTAMSGVDSPCVIVSSGMPMSSHLISTTSAAGGPSVPSQILPPHQAAPDALSEIDAQIHFLQSQRFAEQHRQLEEQRRLLEEQQAAFYAQQQRNMVPPTPQSLEMQASNHFFTLPSQQPQQQQQQQQQQRQRAGNSTPQHSHGMFDRYPRLKDQQDMSFTPLVSPAVTPLDTHFPVETRYTVPGAYFSPLTSPALHAQNPEAVLGFEQNLHGSTATNSPVEMELESNTPPSAATETAKKSRKSNVAKARKPTVRQSPITKPQRKKTASTTVVNAQILSELAETATERREHPPLRPAPASLSTTSAEDSENASVSPEALSEMPPPPLPQPRSARQSPYIAAQPNAPPVSHPLPAVLNGAQSPATPASLFRISPQSRTADASNPGQVASEHIENFELPESANFPATRLPQTSTRLEASSPKLDKGKTPSMAPLPSPGLSRASQPSSSTTSPHLTPRLNNQRKTPLLAARNSKKRASIGSVHLSPALLPRISPNLKPLLPGTPGMTAEDTASRLLTSKSNYQNILEGNTVPGVSYPSELSTNLTSKRTSHKIAEQGRRNRINSALQEIATLLPKSVLKENEEVVESPGSDKGAGKKDSKQAATPNSKANTVEMAIVYIKQLRQEVADANKRAEDAEAKLGLQEAAAAS